LPATVFESFGVATKGFLGFAQGEFAAFSVGDVLRDSGNAGRHGVFMRDAAAGINPADFAGGAEDAVFGFERLGGINGGGDGGFDGGAVFRKDHRKQFAIREIMPWIEPEVHFASVRTGEIESGKAESPGAEFARLKNEIQMLPGGAGLLKEIADLVLSIARAHRDFHCGHKRGGMDRTLDQHGGTGQAEHFQPAQPHVAAGFASDQNDHWNIRPGGLLFEGRNQQGNGGGVQGLLRNQEAAATLFEFLAQIGGAAGAFSGYAGAGEELEREAAVARGWSKDENAPLDLTWVRRRIYSSRR
jgi:hypothetical protein